MTISIMKVDSYLHNPLNLKVEKAQNLMTLKIKIILPNIVCTLNISY